MYPHKRVYVKVVFSVLTLLAIGLMCVPFIEFEEGTFIGVVCRAIYALADRYVGLATTEEFEFISLIALTLLLLMWTFDVFINARLITWITEACWVAAFYFVLVFFQDNGETWITAKVIFQGRKAVLIAAFFLLSVLVMLLFVLRIRSDFKSFGKRKQRTKKEKVVSFTHSSALDELNKTYIPEFKCFPNEIVEEEEEPEFEEEIIPASIECQMSEPEPAAETEIEVDTGITAEIETPEAEPLLQEVEEDEQEELLPEKPKPAKVSSEFVETKDTIIDEGSDGDEDLENAQEQYKKFTEEGKKKTGASVDYVSGVGGLRSSVNGDYLYDSSVLEYKFPSEKLLKHFTKTATTYSRLEDDPDGQTIVDTLAQFKIETNLIGVQHGPTFTLYELSLAKGVRVNTVLNLADNIAMDLAVQSVRILAPIPGKAAIGVEVPNKNRDVIGFDEMIPALKERTLKIPMVLGKTITGDSIIIDLAGAPHLLIAGTTGSGKSVCVNGLICSILFTKTPKEVRMILVDPKMVELTVYNDIPHLLTPVITDAKKAIKAMAFCVQEMERRMSMFSQLGARKIDDYNKKIVEKGLLRAQLPYIVVVIDEFADLMSVVGKELESYIKRITAVARFTGIHLVLATQRPSADVITGIIKSNMPTQIAFAVSNQVNSRIILDAIGAEKLLGRGDMLYASASTRTPQRIQGAYIDSEIDSIVSFVKAQGQPDYIDDSFFEDEDDEEEEDCFGTVTQGMGGEDMFTRAWKIVAERGEASASYLQRRMSIGYNRAANLIEQLEEAGYIGTSRGSKPREILRYPDSRTETGPADDDN